MNRRLNNGIYTIGIIDVNRVCSNNILQMFDGPSSSTELGRGDQKIIHFTG